MGASVKKISGKPIVVVSYSPPFNPAVDLPAVGQQLTKLSQDISGTMHIVIDVSRLKLSFSDIMLGMGESSDNRIKEINGGDVSMTFVGSSEMLAMAKEAYKQKQYGEQQVEIFASVDEALDSIRG